MYVKQSDDDNDNGIIINIIQQEILKGANFGVKLKYLPKEILLTIWESKLKCCKSLYLYVSNI